jgi:hypothetical protein
MFVVIAMRKKWYGSPTMTSMNFPNGLNFLKSSTGHPQSYPQMLKHGAISAHLEIELDTKFATVPTLKKLKPNFV